MWSTPIESLIYRTDFYEQVDRPSSIVLCHELSHLINQAVNDQGRIPCSTV